MATPAFATADVVIVGAGSAGCVVAERLSRDPARRVVLLDAGTAAPAPASQTRLTRLPIEPGALRVHRYPEARGRDVVRGRGLGGSSVVNGGYFLRGHRDDYAAWPWPIEQIAAQFDAVEQTMSVSAFADDEVGTVATAFERYWRDRAAEPAQLPFPAVGLHRIRSNHRDGRRITAVDGFLKNPRPGRTVLGDIEVFGLAVAGSRITGVETSAGRVDAGTVILAAGALGSGALAVPLLGELPIHEHAERLVRFTPRCRVAAPALLQTVLHTADGLELRCYGDDFAAFIAGVPRTGIAIGVADMGVGTQGSLTADALDLGEPDAGSLRRMDAGVDLVREMLDSEEFADLVEPGSVRVDDAIGMSSHAWGSLPLGGVVDAAGAVDGFTGLHVADGSVLPAPLRSGPHASVMAVAGLVAASI
ncbi:mycofactocin system GMC family oxidoreductase MftG [Gordonia hydrophobica]|uniref:Mycofactocin system GMC family oxidoreductase MftG n=1 Tax=Gordonia hydrophobica TaxID=40516 RepID=A0ABZ2TWU5_9ACTN|nr:mycofactocin system GMC family oxidoreductase MftG [Gordonia hydrophobica]MBM7365756.1 GMC family mycofactocin-associated oxidreductase [Gordonia hydrophobica]